MRSVTETKQTEKHNTWIEIRRNRLLANLKAVQERAGTSFQTLAVVKANAYGHGLLEIARTLDGKVTYLGVSSLAEAMSLKEHQIETPVFMFGRLLSPELPVAIGENLTLTLSSLEEAYEVSELSQALSKKPLVHLNVVHQGFFR